MHINPTLRNTQPTQCTVLFIRYLCYDIALNIHKCVTPQGVIIREPNQSITA